MIYSRPLGETEAGNAGEQPRQGITRPGSSTRCANRVGRAIDAPSKTKTHRTDRPGMPKKTRSDQANKHAYVSRATHYEKTARLHFPLNQDTRYFAHRAMSQYS